MKLPIGSIEDTNLEFGQVRITDSIEGPFQQVLLVGLGDLEKVSSESSALGCASDQRDKKTKKGNCYILGW